MKDLKVFISKTQDPYLHLAFEDFLLRQPVGQRYLYIYQNAPCVVMGRFQNPWLEANIPFLKDHKYPLVRRQSGGGCVYHDEGNVNFAYVGELKGLQKNVVLEFLVGELKILGLETKISPRHDLLAQSLEGPWKKISGSAYKQTKDKVLHHGTLLIDTNLDKLDESLKQTAILESTKSLPSVRSQVMNLNEIKKDFTPQSWAHYLKTKFEGEIVDETHFPIQESFEHWRSEKWIWGETPWFEIKIGELFLKIHKGIIKEASEAALVEKEFSAQTLQTYVSADLLKPFFFI